MFKGLILAKDRLILQCCFLFFFLGCIITQIFKYNPSTGRKFKDGAKNCWMFCLFADHFSPEWEEGNIYQCALVQMIWIFTIPIVKIFKRYFLFLFTFLWGAISLNSWFRRHFNDKPLQLGSDIKIIIMDG